MTNDRKEIRMRKLSIDCKICGAVAEVDAAVETLIALGWEVIA